MTEDKKETVNKVLIVGPRYFNFLEATANAFRLLGWDTVIDSYDNPVHPYTTVMKWRYKLSGRKGRDRIQDISRQNYNNHIINVFNAEAPQLVFVMNGDILFTDTLDLFRQDAKVALWLFDTLDRLPTSRDHIDHVDSMFCYDRADVDWYISQGKEASFLPQACDTDTYRPLGLEKDIDILFVGHLYGSDKRQQAMKSVIGSFPDKVIRVYGIYKPWYKGFFRWLFREHRDIYANRAVVPDEVNRLYNRARVVLNIHQEQQKDGANPRTFEICGSGAWQVCDANPFLEALFPDGDVGLYHSEDEMNALIREGLETDCSARARKAYDNVLRNHTFDARIRQVLVTTGL